MSKCKHTKVCCINLYELIRKYKCENCGEVMMCACEEKIARKFLSHQISQAFEKDSQQRIPITLGFQKNVCNSCKGIPEKPYPLAESYGRTSKIHRYYWREIAFETYRRFAKWAEEQGYMDMSEAQNDFPEMYNTMNREAIEEIKRLHQGSPKYIYQEESDSEVLKKNNVHVLRLDGIYVKTDEPRVSILDGDKVCSPEEFAKYYFKQHGYNVLFTESRPFHALFGIFMWLLIQDCNDSKVRVVGMGDRVAFDQGKKGEIKWFSLPEDFGSPDYAIRRKDAMEEHFQRMIPNEKEEFLRSFDYWVYHSADLREYLWAHRNEDVLKAREIASVLPVEVTRRILNYLVTYYWGRYLGWPDLLVYDQNEYFFAEVKSSKDKLREDQKDWIRGNSAELHLPFKLVKIHKQGVIER